jgi:hypothetical protein
MNKKGIVFSLADDIQDMASKSGCTTKETRQALKIVAHRIRFSKIVQPPRRKKW